MAVLIVEDNVVNQKVLARVLELNGWSDIRVHGTAENAAVELGTTPFDLILVDWMLPGLSGVELVRRIRQSRLNAQAPVLIVTAHNQKEHVLEAVRAGVDDFVVKPFRADVLLEKIRRIQEAKASRGAVQA
jgi:two-component system chemotaxis response regulator CheY